MCTTDTGGDWDPTGTGAGQRVPLVSWCHSCGRRQQSPGDQGGSSAASTGLPRPAACSPSSLQHQVNSPLSTGSLGDAVWRWDGGEQGASRWLC